MKIISAPEAANLVGSNWRLVTSGFGSCGHPDALTIALRKRFVETGQPENLKLFFAAGSGDKSGRGLDQLALPGLVDQAIGGFWGLCPKLSEMAENGEIEAHNWPQGVISKLFSKIASKSPGVISHIGIDTFVDPVHDGGVIDNSGRKSLVERVTLKGKDYLFYPSQYINCAFLRGTAADEYGNILFCEETSYMDALAQASAAKNSGGIVVVQVKRLIDNNLEPCKVKIPGFLVDYVVVAEEHEHPQTYGTAFNKAYTTKQLVDDTPIVTNLPLCKKIIVERAALELLKYPAANVNLGIGVPASIGEQAHCWGWSNFTLTVESGLVGGIPDKDLSFGASKNPLAIIEQSALFDFYDGGGLDVAFLGFGEMDQSCNVNVSKLGNKRPGSGGFINISQTAKNIVFCGTFTTDGLLVEMSNGHLSILNEGNIEKFVSCVAHRTFSSSLAEASKQSVMLITERAVFSIINCTLVLIEIAPGIKIESIVKKIPFQFEISTDLKFMACPVFSSELSKVS